MSAIYLDSSAIVKLATEEAESDALRSYIAQHTTRLTSRVATVEVQRALARKGAASVAGAGELVTEVLKAISVIELDEEISVRAASLRPPTLRTWDAIHLASAITMGSELVEVITYDSRFADAAQAAGLAVSAPA